MPSAPKFEAPQGEPLHEVEFRAITESLAGNGVLSNSDLEVTNGANPMEIDVATGTVYYIASEHDYGGASPAATLSEGDATYNRWDTIAFDTGSTSTVVREGTPEQYPTAPDIGGDELLLATVYIPAGATDIDNSNIRNWRAKFSNEAEEVHYNDNSGVYGVSDVAAALDELGEAAQIGVYPLALADLDSPFPPADIASVNGYPFPNSDLANSTIDVGAGTGLTTTNVSIGLGGGATLSVDESFSPTWTGEHAFDLHQTLKEQAAAPGVPAGGYAQVYPRGDGFVYSQDDAGRERRVGGDLKTAAVGADYTTSYEDILFVDPAGTGGLAVTLASADARDGHGFTVIDAGRAAGANPITIRTDGSEAIDGGVTKEIAEDGAQLLLESDGADWYTSGGAAAVGVNTDEFNTDESGTVDAGNSGAVYAHELADQETVRVLRAGLLLADGQPAPSGLDLLLARLDNAGAASKQTEIITGDGTVQTTETGDPLASYQNTSGGPQTVGVLVDNGNFNAGTGSPQDLLADCQGEVV